MIDSAPRWRGIQKFAQSTGLEIDPALVVQLPDAFDPNSSFEGGQRFTEELLQKKKRFTALLAFDDLTALGAIRALTKAGVKVPEQCSVIGFDDVPLSALSAPSLTTVRQPLEAMGDLAVNVVMEGVNASLEKRDLEYRAAQNNSRTGHSRFHACGCRWRARTTSSRPGCARSISICAKQKRRELLCFAPFSCNSINYSDFGR